MEEMTTEQEDSIGEANVFALHPDGFRVHFKLRTGTPESVIKEMNRLVKGLMVGGYKPDEKGAPGPSAPAQQATDVPHCPDCGGEVYDNRGNRPSPKSPHFKCKNKSCAAVGWLADGGQVSWQKGRGQGNQSGQRY